MYLLSGEQFSGSCLASYRPCEVECACGCHGFGDCGWWATSGDCCCPPRVDIGYGLDVTEIVEVKIDGVVVDPATYRLDERRWLVRLTGADGVNPSWPCCGQDMSRPPTMINTFIIDYLYGLAPPSAGKQEAARLACEFGLLCSPSTAGLCQLPKTMTGLSRQGVSMTFDAQSFLKERRTGLYSVDLWLKTINPYGLSRSAQVVSPDDHLGIRS
ncbi:MAG: hypothetical protein ACR2M4_03180 [Actinomycetota bacterium]